MHVWYHAWHTYRGTHRRSHKSLHTDTSKISTAAAWWMDTLIENHQHGWKTWCIFFGQGPPQDDKPLKEKWEQVRKNGEIQTLGRAEGWREGWRDGGRTWDTKDNEGIEGDLPQVSSALSQLLTLAHRQPWMGTGGHGLSHTLIGPCIFV